MGLRRFAIGLVVAAGATLAPAPPARAALVAVDYASPGDGLLTRDTQSGLEWLDLTATIGPANSISDILAALSAPSFVFESFASILFTDVSGVEIGGGRFRYATREEVITLWEHAGVPPSASFTRESNTSPAGSSSFQVGDPALPGAVTQLQSLIGARGSSSSSNGIVTSTRISETTSAGVYLSAPDAFSLARLRKHFVQRRNRFRGTSSARLTVDSSIDQVTALDPAQALSDAGHYLVRTATVRAGGQPASVPEPGTLLLLAAGALGWRRSRRRPTQR